MTTRAPCSPVVSELMLAEQGKYHAALWVPPIRSIFPTSCEPWLSGPALLINCGRWTAVAAISQLAWVSGSAGSKRRARLDPCCSRQAGTFPRVPRVMGAMPESLSRKRGSCDIHWVKMLVLERCPQMVEDAPSAMGSGRQHLVLASVYPPHPLTLSRHPCPPLSCQGVYT